MPLGKWIETPDECHCSDWTLIGTNFFGDELLPEEVTIRTIAYCRVGKKAVPLQPIYKPY